MCAQRVFVTTHFGSVLDDPPPSGYDAALWQTESLKFVMHWNKRDESLAAIDHQAYPPPPNQMDTFSRDVNDDCLPTRPIPNKQVLYFLIIIAKEIS